MHPPNSCREQRRRFDDSGSTLVEFIFAGLLLLVPLVYLIVALGLVQGQALGVESGARHIARAVATAPDAASADSRARAVLRSIIAEYGIDADAVHMALDCVPAGDPCPRAGATVTVTLSTRTALPLAPPVLGLDRLASVPLQAASTQRMSRTWATG